MGSHNLISSDYGGRRGAPWIDITGRFTGAVARQLGLVFAEDWAFETGRMLDLPPEIASTGDTPMQVVPTGPAGPGLTYRRLLLGAIQLAREHIVLTTPYFVPDEPTLVAMLMAADRGVEVQLLIPLVSDHIFTAAAGRAHFSKLLEGGVSIFQYRPGLLHAKTATIDDAVGFLGSANLDVRSFNLNFELTALLYGKAATERLRTVQSGYLADSRPLDPREWCRRSMVLQCADNAVSLLSPLL
jgi:cardiolipin synthase